MKRITKKRKLNFTPGLFAVKSHLGDGAIGKFMEDMHIDALVKLFIFHVCGTEQLNTKQERFCDGVYF